MSSCDGCAPSSGLVRIAFEPTGDYHRPSAYWLGQDGFRAHQVSSLAVARTREALYNSWVKNDPKDAQVISASAEDRRHADLSRSAADRVPRSPGDGEHLP